MTRFQKKLDILAEDAKALDRVWRLLGNKPLDTVEKGLEIELVEPSSLNGTKPISFVDAMREAADRGELVRTIRRVIEDLPHDIDITSELIRARIESMNPDLLKQTHPSSIPGTLGQLRKNKELEMIQKGAGRRHAVYRKAPSV